MTEQDDERVIRAWNEHRPYLVDLAFRVLGDIGAAEDVVQDAFARLLRTPRGEISDDRGWLIVVTSRLCLDQIRSARSRRERPHDASEIEFVPGSQPPVGLQPATDPADRITLDNDVQLALLVVLQRLSPAERVAFVLHDIFGVPFDSVAQTIGRPAATCRQLARRARQKIKDSHVGATADVGAAEHRQVTEKFIAACAGGDLNGLLEVLAPDAWVRLRRRPGRPASHRRGPRRDPGGQAPAALLGAGHHPGDPPGRRAVRSARVHRPHVVGRADLHHGRRPDPGGPRDRRSAQTQRPQLPARLNLPPRAWTGRDLSPGFPRHFLRGHAVLTGAARWRSRSAPVPAAPVRGKGTTMLNLKIIIGSTRPGRAADRIVPWISQAAREHSAFDVDVPDLRDWQLPIFGETFATLGDPANPTFSVPEVRRWNDAILAGDAYLFITPEYNHSVPAVLKNAINSVFATFAFRNKPAAFLAYSGGIGGGIRAVEHLAHIAVEAELVPLRNTVVIPYVTAAFGPDGGQARTTGPAPRPRSCSTTWPGGQRRCSGPAGTARCRPPSCAGPPAGEHADERIASPARPCPQ